ncbi:DUF4380 domain-containing protein [Flammeovirga sp. MY04]|uniref:DUF4380 domain-containing protein n=1 Tax=Flammeovirga sp. MY04 TaxID=1191459 RepID=UPI0008062B29|nr:DUF4380 domain-containing protein [Flammeovirga sp. MY04]ANQ52591.1 DUF4380 domain-containing protein [Flammeovirga sp. MY04]
MKKKQINNIVLLLLIVFPMLKVEAQKLQSESTEVTFDIERGGRIAQVTFNGTPLLFDGHKELGGSVWWPAPQTLWGWPPPEEIDLATYSVVSTSSTRSEFESKECPSIGIQLKKEYKLKNKHQLSITYTATNISNKQVDFGHWEVSRVPKGGEIMVKVDQRFDDNIPLANEKYLYIDHQKFDKIYDPKNEIIHFNIGDEDLELPYKGKNKLFIDSKGWVAYLIDNVLFIKVIKNEPLASITPSQGEIEIYVSPILPMVEVEQHSAYQHLSPQETSSWTVDWLMYEVNLNDKELLLEFIEQTVENFKATN